MTKEELYNTIEECINNLADVSAYVALDEFFKDKVIIQRGENRHQYADVYHEAVEGRDWQWSEDGVNWFDVVPPMHEYYRIKPKEPVYEYKYSIVLAGKQYISEEYKTIEEIKDFNNTYLPIAIKQTKRIRQ